MKRYRTREAITFAPGARLELAPEQSGPRAAIGALRPVSNKKRETVFTVERQVEFKAGEIIGTDGEMSRAMMDRLEPVDADGNPLEDTSAGSAEAAEAARRWSAHREAVRTRVAEEAAKEDGSEIPTAGQVRAMNKDQLIALADTWGLAIDRTATNDEMADAAIDLMGLENEDLFGAGNGGGD